METTRKLVLTQNARSLIFVHHLPTALPQSQYQRGNYPAQPAHQPAKGLQTGPILKCKPTSAVA